MHSARFNRGCVLCVCAGWCTGCSLHVSELYWLVLCGGLRREPSGDDGAASALVHATQLCDDGSTCGDAHESTWQHVCMGAHATGASVGGATLDLLASTVPDHAHQLPVLCQALRRQRSSHMGSPGTRGVGDSIGSDDGTGQPHGSDSSGTPDAGHGGVGVAACAHTLHHGPLQLDEVWCCGCMHLLAR